MKNSISALIVFSICLVTIIVSCSKEEENIEPVVPEPTPTVTMNNPSPCTSSLTDNQVECTPNVFPNATVNPTVVLLSSTQMDGSVPGFSQGGDIDIRFGNAIEPGLYTLVDNSSPSAGQASISMTPNICSICPFRATSGTLYITETATQWIAEWCSVNFNSITVTPNSSVTGRMIANK